MKRLGWGDTVDSTTHKVRTGRRFMLLLLRIEIMNFIPKGGDRGGTVVKVLCYKSEDRWFDPRWCHWNFSLT